MSPTPTFRLALAASTTAAALLLLLAACGGSGEPPADADRTPPRGGTFRVDSAAASYPIDPATGYSQSALLEATQLTLVGLSSAATGAGPLPEAAALPRVSADGRTYTFTIRRGFRFSDGTPLTAAHFAYAFHRLLEPRLEAYPGSWLLDVVGAQAVVERRAESISGIVARGNRLTIRLRRPVPELLAKLALPSFGAVPLGLPAPRGGYTRAPLHSPGPYYVKSFVPGEAAVLERNPHWRPALVPRRPAHVDRIVVTFNVSPEKSVADVERGTADLTRSPAPELFRDLVAKHGVNRQRVFVRPRLAIYWLLFNHEQPLFKGNARLRRAVNLALDRPHLVRQASYLIADPTDQLVPPAMPGFRDHRLYPLDRPAVELARRLARASLRGGKAVLWAAKGDDERFAEVVRYDLRRIGLDVRIERVSLQTLLNRLPQPGQPWDLVLAAWIGDYPDPVNFVGDALLGMPWSLSDAEFAADLARTSSTTGAQRYTAFARLERHLMRDLAPAAPIMSLNSGTFVSARVGCLTFGWHGFVRWDAVCLR